MIVGHALPERLHHADVLMSQRRPLLHPLVFPVVDVGAADPRQLLPHQDRARRRPDYGILSDRDLDARERAPEYRERIAEFRRTNMATLAELKSFVDRDEQITSLQSKLSEYWEAFDPLFDWTTSEKILQSANFLRREVVPRREAALAIADD